MMTSLRHKDFSSAPGNRRRSRLPRPEAEIRAELIGSDEPTLSLRETLGTISLDREQNVGLSSGRANSTSRAFEQLAGQEDPS